MNRNQAKDLLPIIQAFAEGKAIESRCIKGDKSLWYNDEDPNFDNDFEYRIKQESKYRPFRNIERCLEEMQKHQPFGWIKRNGYWYNIISTGITNVKIIDTRGAISTLCFDDLLSHYSFVDGTPFGVKEEE